MLDWLLNSMDPEERMVGISRLHPEDPKLVEIYLNDKDKKVRDEAYGKLPKHILDTL